MKQFKFELGQEVVINVSAEVGTVRARSDSTTGADQYHVVYKSALGTACESWWTEDQLSAAE